MAKDHEAPATEPNPAAAEKPPKKAKKATKARKTAKKATKAKSPAGRTTSPRKRTSAAGNGGSSAAGKNLVIVESPAKARTIERYLGSAFQVMPSIGHVIDLPKSKMAVDIENDFQPEYTVIKGKKSILDQIKRRAREANAVYLAPDPDREGEAIAYHIAESIRDVNSQVYRATFNEITRTAVNQAINSPTQIDLNLFNAQQARRVLDRLVGYNLSPLLWRKVRRGLSAGRVQSVAVRLICDREAEIEAFKAEKYWTVEALAHAAAPPPFKIALQRIDDRKAEIKTLELAEQCVAETQDQPFVVSDVVKKEVAKRPFAPFITSTLQQEGNRKLGLTARETMRTAQRLYEEGFITYMRTDSPTLSGEAIAAARTQIGELYGNEFLPEEPRQFSSSSRDAQEAHEAIRPAGTTFRAPDQTGLSGRERALYELIWKRTLASQMADAKKRSLSVRIGCGVAVFQANGNQILFPGFLRVYVEGSDNPEAALEQREVLLPPLEAEDLLAMLQLDAERHQTKPPARYTEASLVQKLEKLGIGRPSTYATIINTLFERGYVRRVDRALVPTFTGMAVVQLLEHHFGELIEYSFTSDMETALDEIAFGERESKAYLREFYLGDDGLQQRVEEREAAIKPEESRTVALPQLSEHQRVRIGRYGPYIIHHEDDEEIHASIPEEYSPADLTEEDIHELVVVQKNGPAPIGVHPETGDNIYCLTGRYGPYLQLGEADPDSDTKPKRAGLPKGVKPSEVDIPLAVKLLSLPRTLGIHPERGEEVVANVGRFGPYVVCDGDFRSLKRDDDVYTITLDRAVELLAEEKKGRGRGPKLIRELGTEPGKQRKISLYDGRYGPYLKVGTKNVSLPEDKRTPEALEKLTLEEAAALVKRS